MSRQRGRAPARGTGLIDAIKISFSGRARRSPSARPAAEALESRLVPAYQPTAAEQLFLERLNDARANPPAYGASIGLDLSNVAPSMPLAMDTRIVQAARDHSQDMNDRRFFGHSGSNGSSPGQRMTANGYPAAAWAESIAAGFATPEDALRGLIVDAGVPDLGHRRHLLAMDANFQSHREIGVGIVQNGSGPYRHYYTADTGRTSDTRPYLTGSVFRDTNGNGKYDLGEGLAGVNVGVTGAATTSTTTFASGGYSLQLPSGSYTVTFSGGSLAAPVTRAVTLGTWNYRLGIAAPTVVTDLGWSAAALTLPVAADTRTPFTIGRSYVVTGSAAPANFTIAYYASTDRVAGNADDLFLGSETISAAADKTPGPHAGTSPAYSIPRAGSQYVVAVLDPGTTVDETDELNNAFVSLAPVNVTGVTELVLDDGTATYSQVGAWGRDTGYGYGNALRYIASGTGSAQATWQIAGLADATYTIQATWTAWPNHATDAPYRVYDGTTLVATFRADQVPDPRADATVGGSRFQTLGTARVSGGTLRVVLGNDANGYVVADAVRVVSQAAPPPPQQIDLGWSAGGLTGPGSAVDTQTSFTLARSYTVSGGAAAPFAVGYYASADAVFGNADDVLLATEPLSTAADLAAGPHAGTSPSLRVTAAGTYHLFAKVDAANAVAETQEDNNVIQAAGTLTVNPAAAQTAWVVDDGGAGYSEVGSWAGDSGYGHGNSLRYTAGGNGSARATWQVSNLAAGYYKVQATWTAWPTHATNAPYRVYDGTTHVATFHADQVPASAADDTAGGAPFQTLGSVRIRNGALRVVLGNDANGYVVADAVRVVAVPAPSLATGTVLDDGTAAYTQVGAWGRDTGYGYGNALRYSSGGNGSAQATWQMAGLADGTYTIQATWTAWPNHATNAPYRVYDGNTLVATFYADQVPAPAADATVSGTPFQTLGSVRVRRGALRVVLGNDANGYVVADAVRVTA